MLKLSGLAFLLFQMTADAEIRFEDVTETAGLIEPIKGIMVHGGAFGDVDSDGLPDLYVGGFADRPDEDYEPAAGPSPNVLLRNLGGLKFKEANDEAGLPDDIFGLGLAVGDVNGDGRPDFFVGHSNRMFFSSGNGYEESPDLNKIFAMDPMHNEDWPCGAAFGDLNGYGYASGQIARCHFGLGDVKKIDIELEFPNGKTRRIESVEEVNGLMTIKE